MIDALGLLAVANAEFVSRLRLVATDDWERPIPCTKWDVRRS
jgi:hypothetical protein